MLERWEPFTTEEIEAIHASVTYANMMGANYGADATVDQIKQETEVVIRERQRANG